MSETKEIAEGIASAMPMIGVAVIIALTAMVVALPWLLKWMDTYANWVRKRK